MIDPLAFKIDMTPPNIQTETIKQVVKILKSPGCRYGDASFEFVDSH